ncbi:MAG TPA: HypC/HybG/HupF family hydrogenase formation chaperone [Acidimicrobiia bacterium]|nr:HypC/HybG/HupF family hydrogenase formation chaperone [Acidimicrobiia bacterium]
MCLSAPGRITETYTSETGTRMGRVSFAGIDKSVCLLYVPDAAVGDHVIVHLGFAIRRLDEEEAREIIESLREIEAYAALG